MASSFARAARDTALLAALLQPSLAGQDQPAAAPKPLVTFAWPVPSQATVLETVFKDGKESKTRYTLTMTRRESGGIRVRYSDFEFVEVAGMDATTPKMKERLAAATALASAIPDIHVDPGGSFEAATGLEAVMDKVVDFLAESRGWSAEEKAGVRKNMGSSGMMESLKRSVGQYWDAWAGAWIGWNTPAGATLEEERKLPVLGEPAAASVRLRNLGAPRDQPSALSLERRVRADGQKFSVVMATYVGDLIDRFAGEQDLDDVLDQLTFSLDETYTVTTAPATLLPATATTARTVTATNRATGERLQEVERHRYEFTWTDVQEK